MTGDVVIVISVVVVHDVTTGCSLNIVFFPRILETLPFLSRQHSAAICCTKKTPIGVTVPSHCVESFEGLLFAKRG